MDVVSTAEVPAGERFAFWREAHSKIWAPLDVRCDPQVESGFSAQVVTSEFDSVQTTLVTTMPHSIHRSPRLIRKGDPDVFHVGCMVRGGGTVTKDGRQSAFGVGDMLLYDLSHPYAAEFAPDESVSQLLLLGFPRSRLPIPAQDLRRLSAVRIPGAHGMGALSSQFLLNLARHLHELSPSETARLSTLTLDVLAMALADALDSHGTVPPQTARRALMAQIHAFVQDNLGDAALDPATIAAAHHISLRYLHKLFQQDGHTVAGYIREHRLERCRRDLADPHLVALPIHAIAARWGFTNPAHFSQAFRGAHGLSPRQYRRRNGYG